jgi:NADH:ubiquinone oxidoreductase subunit C
MNLNDLVESIVQKLGKKIKRITLNESSKRAEVVIDRTDIKTVAKYLLDEREFRLVIATAVQLKRDFDIYYHFGYDPLGLILNLKVTLPYEDATVKSLAPISIAANWIEREIHELYGINFEGHPNMKKLISDGNWDEGVYPYRKDFEPKPTRS